jgi:hypothetical protein
MSRREFLAGPLSKDFRIRLMTVSCLLGLMYEWGPTDVLALVHELILDMPGTARGAFYHSKSDPKFVEVLRRVSRDEDLTRRNVVSLRRVRRRCCVPSSSAR